MSGFASELARSKSAPPSAPPPPASAEAPTAPAVSTEPTGLEMPAHGDVHPEQKPETTVTDAPPAPVNQTSGKIKIGTEYFDSADDAIDYATKLQLELATKDAYEQGKREGQPKPETPPEVDEFAEFDSTLFEDPKAALKKVYAKAVADAKKEIRADQAREATLQKTWGDFYSSNADLSSNQDLVNIVLQRDWNELGSLPSNIALEKVAERTRALLGSRRESTLPSKELQNKTVTSTGASSVATPAASTKPQSGLDFISQIKKHGKRT